MAILIPAKSLTGPQGGATGILAGLLQGLAQGMPIGEQLKNQKRRTDLADQEMQLRRGQIGRQNAREDAAQRAAAILAKFGSMSDEDEPDTMGGGGPAPSTSGASDAEMGGTGPPTQGPPAPAQNGWEGFQPAGMAAAFGAGPPVQGPTAPGSAPPAGPLPQGANPDIPGGYTPPPQRDDKGRPISGAGWEFGPNGEVIAQPAPLAITRAGPLPIGSKQGAQPSAPGGQPQGPTAGVQGLHPGTSKRLEWIHGILSDPEMTKGMSQEDIHGILAAAQHDEGLRAVKHHAERVVGDLQTDLDKGKFDSVDEQGRPDLSGRAAAQAAIDAVKRADPRDPKEMAKVIDAAEAANQQLKTHAALKQGSFEHKQAAGQAFDAQLSEMSQGKSPLDPSVKAARGYLAMWKAGQVSDEEMSKNWPSIMDGTFAIKRQMQQSQAEAEGYKADAEKWRAIQQTPQWQQFMESLGEKRDIAREGERGNNRFTNPAKPPSANSQMQAIKSADEWLQGQGLTPGTPEYKAAEAELMKRIGMNGAAANEAQGGQKAPAGKDTAQSLWSAFKGGQISKEELKKRAAAAGLSPDEFKALAGAK